MRYGSGSRTHGRSRPCAIGVHVVGDAVLDDHAPRELGGAARGSRIVLEYAVDQRAPVAAHAAVAVQKLVVAARIAAVALESRIAHRLGGSRRSKREGEFIARLGRCDAASRPACGRCERSAPAAGFRPRTRSRERSHGCGRPDAPHDIDNRLPIDSSRYRLYRMSAANECRSSDAAPTRAARRGSARRRRILLRARSARSGMRAAVAGHDIAVGRKPASP